MRILEVLKEYLWFRKFNDGRFRIIISKNSLKLDDKTKDTPFDAHYIYHPAWALRVLKKIKPREHIDISSTLYFPVMASAFFKVRYYDLRPAKVYLSNLKSEEANLMRLPFKDQSVESLSCMHTIEHIGLGRYGDQLDIKGDLKALNELKRVLKKKGNLLLVVPVGKPKIFFNAHRIYSYDQIIKEFEGFKLMELAMIPDDASNGMVINPSKRIVNAQRYACGCFWFKKL